MEPIDCSTPGKKYTHLSEKDRYKIEALLDAKKKLAEVALILGRDPSTIHREINRGSVRHIESDLTEKKKYRANVAQADYLKQCRNRERSLKIGKDKRLEEHIRTRILEKRFSPDAVIGEIKVKGLKFEGMICTKTLYNYIEAGVFSGISNKNLWHKRHQKKRKYTTVVRVSRTNRLGKSIEDRPKEIESRQTYGHWEGDSVKGPQGAKPGLLTLTERKAREEIILKVGDGSQAAVKAAFDKLERKYGDAFRMKFKSVTFDNGHEFLNWETLEVSMLRPGERRMAVYFAHSYSSWERGTNENHNRMIRRFIPKGTDIAKVDDKKIRAIEDWMNNYPRRILGYNTPNEVSRSGFRGSSVLGLPIAV